MTIVFTGGGTGGHFYPLIAITEAIGDLTRERRLLAPKLYFLGPEPFDKQALYENGIAFIRIPAGKMRRYFSILNFTGVFTTLAGIFAAIIVLFRLYPDVVVSKGGYSSVPTVLAAWILRIPIVVHESDAKPGRANLLGAKFAKRIAISFDSAAQYFPEKLRPKIARTGTPIRKALTRLEPEGAREYLNLESGIPTILIFGGSQGSEKINQTVTAALTDLISFANVIHQTGVTHIKEMESLAKVVLNGNPHADRYHPFDYLSVLSIQRAAAVADLVISRAGTGTIAEICQWKKPAILIPIPEAISHDQRMNAYAFARTGAAVVIEETNLSPHLFASEARRIVSNPELAQSMGSRAAGFNDPDAAKILAGEVLSIALSHES